MSWIMATVTIDEITESLRKLPPEKLIVVYDFVSYLSERVSGGVLLELEGSALDCMLASEAVLRENWDRPEEDAAWARF